jgi:hypothetical protein
LERWAGTDHLRWPETHDALILHVIFSSLSPFQISYVSFPSRLVAFVQDASGHPIA